MLYQINGNPIGISFPPHVACWLRSLKAKGKKIGSKIQFKITELKAALVKEKQFDVAAFLEQNNVTHIEFPAKNCIFQRKNKK